MANNLNRSPNYDDEIDLREIIKILLASKKLIISTILIFTIASIIYSFSVKPEFKSSSLLEIGYYEMPNGTKQLIEKPSDLISDLEVLLLKKPDNQFNQNVSIKSLEGKVINLEITSSSAEQNVNLLTEFINYIVKRHSRYEKLRSEQNKNKISFDIENTKAEINHFKAKLSSKYQSQYLDIISNLEKEDQAIENLKLLAEISSYEDRLFSLNQQLKILIQNLEDSDSEVTSKSQTIGDIQTNTIKSKTLLFISMGIILGFITGIFLSLINNFIKSYRES